MADERPKSIMRSLGEFFGHIAHGIKTDPTKPPSAVREVKRTVEETRRDDGVILRRTVIEEVELRPGQVPPTANQPHDQPADRPSDGRTEAPPEATKDDPPCPSPNQS